MTGLMLENARALVTGSTSGIGKAIAERLASEGAELIVTGRSPARGAEVVDGLRKRGAEAHFVAADIATWAGARDLARQALARFPDLDILVNNAGAYYFAPVAAISDAQFEEMVALNLRAVHVLGAELLPAMAARGRGAVVNVSSVAAQAGSPGASVYGATKAAVELLTKAWAHEFGPAGVRVNAIAPGPTHTPGTAANAEAVDTMTTRFPIPRPAGVDEIAAAAAFLASEQASYIQGATVNVDGGAASALLPGAAT